MDVNTPEKEPMTYEETPAIESVKEEPDMFPPPKPRTNVSSIITTIIFFILLFVIGFWLSGTVRTSIGNLFGGKNTVSSTPSPTQGAGNTTALPSTVQDQYGSWILSHVLIGTTRVPYEGISFKLPGDVLAPICDGSACGSQGTYLPGGTRFTVALRGEGQVLPDYRGRVISDLYGKPFTITETTIHGQNASEYTGTFTGTTVGGYVFTQMHGYMIPITDTLSLEINHFSPSGISADFAKDDVLFDQIIDTLLLPMNSTEKGSTGTSSATPRIVE